MPGAPDVALRVHRQPGLNWHGTHQRLYRLIDGCCEPHRQLDALYASLDEALSDAVHWIERYGMDPLLSLVGVEVCAANGDWRTYRLPMPLLCALPG